MKKLLITFKNTIFFISLIVVSGWIAEATVPKSDSIFFYAIALALVLFYIWEKIDNKFFK